YPAARRRLDLPAHRHRAPLGADPPLPGLTAMPLTLEQLNAAGATEAIALLDGLYEHSPWIAEAALAQRPFRSLAQLKHAMVQVLAAAPQQAQIALIRAHPELAGKAMVA